MSENIPDQPKNEPTLEERHVDEMMDPKLPDPVTATENVKNGANSNNGSNGDDTDSLVDDIVAHEGDELLAAQDADVVQAFVAAKPSTAERLKQFLSDWWDNKPVRYGTLGVLAALLSVVGVVPVTRYAVLNTVGVRAASSLTILDNTTGLPLKNVSVTVGSTSAKTNDDGVVRLHGLRLGHQALTVKQLGFASLQKTVVLGLGSNPLGDVNLVAVGTQFKFVVTDYVSGKPVGSAEVSNGDANAQANDKGEIILTVGKLQGDTLQVAVSAAGYRDEKLTVSVSAATPTNVVLVSTRKEVFVSKQSGRYDVYKVDIDGQNKQLLLAGTGLERPQLTLLAHPTDNLVALVSSRNNDHNQDGYLLDTLTIINVDNGSTLQLDQSEQIRIVDWTAGKLIYVKVKAGTSAGNSERYQLMSYDYGSTKRLQLASANYFADIVSAKGTLYYASGNYYTAGQSQFVRINPDNTGKQVLLSGQVWSILRAGYSDLTLSGDYSANTQNWYSYHLGDANANKLSTAPANTTTGRFYLDAADGTRALWTEPRDGKGALLVYDDTAKKDTVLTTQSGLTYPLRWLDSRTVVYRVVTPQETADYVLSLDGGTPHKIVDVTNVSGLGPWQYGY